MRVRGLSAEHLLWIILIGTGVSLAAWPFDGAAATWARSLELSGDFERELDALQQFGQGAFTLVIAWVIWLLDPQRRRRLLDLFLAKAVLGLLVWVAKATVGRPRPQFEDPWYVAGPFGAYPVPGEGVRRAWGADGLAAELASMPSGHTAHAVLFAVFVSILYPRIRWPMWVLAGVVAVARVVFGAHYPSDVAVGATLGLLVGLVCTRGFLGVRMLDTLWRLCIDRRATPALPEVLRRERSRR